MNFDKHEIRGKALSLSKAQFGSLLLANSIVKSQHALFDEDISPNE
jgi:hypothetical protein